MAASVLQAVFADDGFAGGSGTTQAVTLTVTAGSTLYVVATCDNTGAVSMSCADNVNGTYGTQLDTTLNDATDGALLAAFRFVNAAAGSTTVTITYGSTITFKGICVFEVGGVKTSSSLDGHTGQVQLTPTTTTDATTSSNASSSNQPALVVGLCINASGTQTPAAGTGFTSNGTGWTAGTPQARAESKRVTATGNQAATFTAGVNGGHLTVVAVFDEISGPTINTQPTNQSVIVGSTANFTISATTSGGTLHYQWKANGSNVGTDTNSYTTAATVMGDDGTIITCVVSDDNGSTTSNNALLNVYIVAALTWITA